LENRTDEETERLVKTLLDVGVDQHPDLNQDDENTDTDEDDDDNVDDDDRILVTARTSSQLRERFDSFTRLRRTFLKYNDEEMNEYFSFLPHFGTRPRRWTSHIECVFFKEICERGCVNMRDILKMPEFEGLLEGPPPCFMRRPRLAMQRLKFILDFIERDSLETLRESGIGKMRRLSQEVDEHLMLISNIAYDENGSPKLPIHLSKQIYVSDLGHIVTDRRGFHTDHYIYPAGFRSSRFYFSTLNPSERVWYTSEILDIGGELPLFRVTMDSHPEISFESNSPSAPWNIIADKAREIRSDGDRHSTVSGPDYFGLTSPIICYLIQQMECADQCVNYVMKQFEKAPPKREETEDSPVVRIPNIAYDENGSPKLPIHLSRMHYVSDLGHIVTDRLDFHTDRYIYPAGFRSARLHFSTLNPSEKVWYTSEILDTGDELPLFRVTMDSQPEISFEGNSPSAPWNIIASKAREIRGNRDRMIGLSGPEYFGLTSPIICHLIQHMEGAEQCVKYVMKRFARLEMFDLVPGAVVLPISASAQNPQPHAGRPICRTRSAWTAEEEETLLRLHRTGRKDWDRVMAALPHRTMAAAKERWKHLRQKKIEVDENQATQPQPQGDFEFPEVTPGRESVTQLVEFPNDPFQAPRAMNARTREAAVGSAHPLPRDLRWTPEEDSILTRLHHMWHNDWKKVVAALPRRTIHAAKDRWHVIKQKSIEHDEDRGTQPQAQTPGLGFRQLPRATQPTGPLIRFPNRSQQSQPDVPGTETEFTSSIALEQGVMLATGFPNERFQAQGP
jgi:hypothetical protein